MLILKKVEVGDFPGLPDALILGISDHRWRPLALEVGIEFLGLLPRSTTWGRLALRVFNHWGFPVAISFHIPVLRHFSIRVGNEFGGIYKPSGGHYCVFVSDELRSRFVPIIRLFGFQIWNSFTFIPVFWFLIFRIINLSWWINRRSEVKNRYIS